MSKAGLPQNSHGRLILVEQYDGDTVASFTAYTYNGVGNLLTMTVGGSTTTYTYDSLGRILTVSEQELSASDGSSSSTDTLIS